MKKLDLQSLKATRQKYLQLGREITEVRDSLTRANLEHTHSKLGMFLGELVGYKLWKQFDSEFKDTPDEEGNIL